MGREGGAMTVKECMTVIEQENKHIDYVFNNVLCAILGHKPEADEKVTFSKWVEFNTEYRACGIHEDSKIIQSHLRENGFDVKMNMQDYKLSYHGLIDGGTK